MGKGCSERKEAILVYEFMVKPGKHGHNIHLFYNFKTYATIFNIVINYSFFSVLITGCTYWMY